jgi:hypothetical protein
LDHLARAKKTDQEAIIKVREEATKEATQKAAEAVVAVGKQEGMSGDLRKKILTAMGVKGV